MPRSTRRHAAPALLYHGATAEVIEPFRPFTHFGTWAAAVQRSVYIGLRRNRYFDEAHGDYRANMDAEILIYPTRVTITAGLRIRDLVKHGNPNPSDVFFDMLCRRVLRREIPPTELDAVARGGADGHTIVAAILREMGHDGLVYRNDHEDRGHDSWVIIEPAQAATEPPVRLTLRDALGHFRDPEALRPSARRQLESMPGASAPGG